MKTIGYTRVSTTAQDLERQRELIKNFCKDNNYTLSAIIEDNGISGAIDDRKGYEKLLSLTKDDADLIVVSELSRISRSEDFITTVTNIYGLLAKGIDLILLDEPNHIYTAKDRLDFMQFMGIAYKAYGAAEERKKIRERTITGKLTKLANNSLSVCPKKAPLGFMNNNGILQPNEKEIPLVKEIFNMVADGNSLKKTANYITYIGYDISFQGIAQIIHNTIYIGKRKIKERIYDIPYHIISDELFYNANKSLKDNDNKKSNYTKHYNPLKGILKCSCGASMFINTAYSNMLYNCYNRKMGRGCKNAGINVKILNDIVWKTVSENINKPTDIRKWHKIQKELNKMQITISNANEKKKKKYDEIRQLLKSKDNLNDLLKGIVDEKIISLQDDIKKIEKDKDSLNSTLINKRAEAATYMTSYNTDNIDEHGKNKIYNEVLKNIIWDNGTLSVNFLNGLNIILIRTKTGWRKLSDDYGF